MANVIVYSSPNCGYCVRAKALLQEKGIDFNEFDIAKDEEARNTMLKKSGGRTSVPQIFINDEHVGGFDDLYALNTAGKLDAMLSN